jgi:hypothetical protein
MPRAVLLAASLLGAGHLGSALLAPPSPLGGIPPVPTRSAPAQAPSQAAALGEALAAIDRCVARLDAEVDVGFRRVALRCPELPVALEHGGFERWLPRDWRDPDNDLSAGGLEELRQLLASELTRRPVSRPPSVRRLRQVLVQLGAPPASGTVWRELERWLRRLGGTHVPSRSAGGLRMLERIDLAPSLTRLVVFAALACLLGLAVLILLNELRTAGVLRVSLRSRSKGANEHPVSAITAAEMEHLSARERPRVLLALVLERLSRTRGLAGLRSLTTRELIREVPFEEAEAARQLAQLALTAERVRYAPTPASAGDLAAAERNGGALLERLTG